jgi:serine/threonine-protein kinase RsbW
MDENERKEAKTIKLTVDSRLEEVFLVGLAVRGVCAYTSLSEMEVYQMEVCVVEAVNNAIKHSYHLKPGHDVNITICLYPERIEFQICNTGDPMKSMEAAKMDFDPKDVMTLPEGGMGLFIIESIMDEVTYQFLDGINTVRMYKRINKNG